MAVPEALITIPHATDVRVYKKWLFYLFGCFWWSNTVADWDKWHIIMSLARGFMAVG